MDTPLLHGNRLKLVSWPAAEERSFLLISNRLVIVVSASPACTSVIIKGVFSADCCLVGTKVDVGSHYTGVERRRPGLIPSRGVWPVLV